MKILLSFLLLLLASLVSGYGGGIIVIDHKNFDHVLAQVKYVMVEFYLPGCTSCQQFAQEYAKAAQRMSIAYPYVKFFEVDGSTDTSLVSRYNIQKFPTVKFFVRGSKTPLDYQGGATADEIVEWVKSKSLSVSMEVQSINEVENYKKDNDLVGLFSGPLDSKAYEDYLEVAKNFEDVVFINTDSEDIRAHYGLGDNESSFVLFKKFDEEKNVYSDPITIESLTNFIKRQKFEVAAPFGLQALRKIFFEGENALILFRKKGGDNVDAEEAFKAASLLLKNKVVTTIVYYDDQVQIPFTELLNVPLNRLLVVEEGDLPAVRLIQPKNKMRRYSLDGSVTEENLLRFFDDFENNKLQPLYISAPIPKDSHEEGVRVVVGKNFKDVVVDDDQDVLVLFCNPNHATCKQFSEIYTKLAQKIGEIINVVVAKVDTSANEVEGLKMRSTLDARFYPRGRKNTPVHYEGEYNEHSLLSFIEEHTGVNWFRNDKKKAIDV